MCGGLKAKVMPAKGTPGQYGLRVTVPRASDLRVQMQQNAAPYDGFGDATLPMTGEWTLLTTSAVATRALTAKTGVPALQLAGAKQVVEIGQINVTAQPAV